MSGRGFSFLQETSFPLNLIMPSILWGVRRVPSPTPPRSIRKVKIHDLHPQLSCSILTIAETGYNIVITTWELVVMVKKLQKVGNSNALILDLPIMEMVGLEEGKEVQITVSNGSIIITPVDPRRVDREELKRQLDRIVGERREMLRELADS
jgi:antitoxin component of MazEF toxin-antitoxin module